MFDFLFGKPFGLSIKDDAVRVIALTGKKQAPTIQAMGSRPLPAGIVVKGQVQKPQKLAEMITDLLKELKITSRKCVLSLPDEIVFEHVFRFPAELHQGKLHEAIKARIADFFPIPAKEATYDYAVIPQKNFQLIFVAAAPTSVLCGYVKTICMSGLKPVLAEPEPLSFMNSLALPLKPEEGAVFIHLTPKSVSWFLFWDGLIFDSNRTSTPMEFLKVFLEDLKNSVDFFEKMTSQKLHSILISGKSELAGSMHEELQKLFSLTIAPFEAYRIPIQKEADAFRPVSGAALKAADASSFFSSVNLFKNYKSILASKKNGA
ncbi:MAG: pilus assembly protein PilM [Candidatus Peregrinibacteria bacterium]